MLTLTIHDYRQGFKSDPLRIHFRDAQEVASYVEAVKRTVRGTVTFDAASLTMDVKPAQQRLPL